MKFERPPTTHVHEPSPEHDYFMDLPGVPDNLRIILTSAYLWIEDRQNFLKKFVTDHPIYDTNRVVTLIQSIATCASPMDLWNITQTFRQNPEHQGESSPAQEAYDSLFIEIQSRLSDLLRGGRVNSRLRIDLVREKPFKSVRTTDNFQALLHEHGLQRHGWWSYERDKSELTTKELEAAAAQYGAWARRLHHTLAATGYEAMLQELGRIFFQECGYITEPAIYRHLPRSVKEKVPLSHELELADSWVSLGAYRQGNCNAKNDGIILLLRELSMQLDVEQRVKNPSAVQLPSIRTDRLLGEPELGLANDDDKFREQRFVSAGNLPDLGLESRQKQLPTLTYFEEWFAGGVNTLGAEHVRTIVRYKSHDSAAQYFAIESKGKQLIQDWTPEPDGCYKWHRFDYGSKDDMIPEIITLFGLIKHDFVLPDDFVFQADPINKYSGGNVNWIRSTKHEPKPATELPARHAQETVVAEVQSLPIELMQAVAKLNINPVQEQATSTAISSRAANVIRGGLDLSFGSSGSLIEKLLDYAERYPFIPVGAAFTAVCMGLANTSWTHDMQESLDDAVHTGADVLEADQNTTAAFAYLAEQSTTPQHWETDLKLAQPLLPKLAGGLDLVWSGSIHNGKLTSSTEPSGDKIKQLSIDHGSDQHTTINVQLGSAIQTVEPSFWIPVLRQMTTEPGQYTISIQGDQLNTTAVASSFASIWNRFDQSEATNFNLNLTINDQPILEANQHDHKLQNRSLAEEFIVERHGAGRILPSRNTARAAAQACHPHAEELPSKWRDHHNAVWVAPLCK